MRHSNSGRKFSRTPSHRKALLQNLAKALLTHTRLNTTEHKAKDLRGVVERLITLAKRDDLHSRRLAYRVLGDHALVKRLFDCIGPGFAGIPGGYTRVTKLAHPRRGDGAAMAVIELTRDPVPPPPSEKTKKRPLVDSGASADAASKPKRAPLVPPDPDEDAGQPQSDADAGAASRPKRAPLVPPDPDEDAGQPQSDAEGASQEGRQEGQG